MTDVHFLDTNQIIRYITRDHPLHAQQAYQLFRQLSAGQVTVVTCEGVIVEVVQVLTSKVLYNRPRADVRSQLRHVLTLTSIQLPHKRTYLRALDLFVGYSRLDFVDALQVAHMERLKITKLLSFDRDFDRVPGVTRREPPVPL